MAYNQCGAFYRNDLHVYAKENMPVSMKHSHTPIRAICVAAVALVIIKFGFLIGRGLAIKGVLSIIRSEEGRRSCPLAYSDLHYSKSKVHQLIQDPPFIFWTNSCGEKNMIVTTIAFPPSTMEMGGRGGVS